MFQKRVIVVFFPSLEFNKRKGRVEGREEEETHICTFFVPAPVPAC